MSQREMGFSFRQFDAEEFFVKRLADHRRTIHAGVTDPAIRRQRIREAILAGGLDCTIIGRDLADKPETYAASFLRHFGEALVPSTKAKRRASGAA